MPRYYFHIKDEVETIRDQEGISTAKHLCARAARRELRPAFEDKV